jgi:CRISPR-associated protein Csm1
MKEYQPGQDISSYTTLLHGDVSGIQDFIFNIRSEGAAKTLKARSFFIQALTTLCVDLIEDRLGQDSCLLFYNGGGGFFIFCKDLTEATFQEIRTEVQRELQDVELYLSLSYVPIDVNNFAHTWRNIRKAARLDKMRKFDVLPAAFEPQKRYKANDEHWKKFAGRLNRSCKFDNEGTPGVQKLVKDTITLFGRHLRLDQKRTSERKPRDINWYLPTWDKELIEKDPEWIEYINRRNRMDDSSSEEIEVREGTVIDFESMGYFAKKRTGTDKIAVLKMDVDNLGLLFSSMQDWSQSKITSSALKQFFEEELLKIWEGTFPSIVSEVSTPYKQTIYPVFAGGDDCLVIGAWDAVLAFALEVGRAFEKFSQQKQKELGLQKPLTLSAGIVMVDSRFPVVRMGALAEEALSAAKTAADGEKAQVFIFGKVLKWKEFEEASNIADKLERLIKVEKEPRGILQRIRNSHTSFEKQMRRAVEEGKIYNPAVWRLMYYIRGSKNKDSLQEIIQHYQKALLEAVVKRFPGNADRFPVAARWAEFKTKKSDNN